MRSTPLVVVKPETPRPSPPDNRLSADDGAGAPATKRSWRRALADRVRIVAEAVARHWLLLVLVALWQYFSMRYTDLHLQLPPPTDVYKGAVELISKGLLQQDIIASLKRVGTALAAASLMPNHSMLNGIQASGGIGRKKPTTGSNDHAK